MWIFEDLGIRRYDEVWNYQEKLFALNVQAKADNKTTQNHLLFCEHEHTITIGKNGKNENLLYDESFLKSKSVSLFHIDRGGDITYHGPGQLVVYPIFDLESFGIGLREYIYRLEEVMIRFLSMYDVNASRFDGAAGVWIDANPVRTRKIGAIGVRSSRFITMHGFALNLNTDLRYFSLINPCGFVDKGVTSLEKEIGKKIDIAIAKKQIIALFGDIFVIN